MHSSARARWATISGLLLAAACTDDSNGGNGANADPDAGAVDAGGGEAGRNDVDAAGPAGPDGGLDAGLDASLEAGLDAGDASSDASVDLVSLVGVEPTDAALHVSVLAPVKLTFSGPLLASSVDSSSVRLVQAGAVNGLPAAVSYDAATHVVTLTPDVPLATNKLHRLVATGLKDSLGRAIADVAVSFRTVVSSVTDSDYYSGGSFSSGIKYTLDADGRAIVARSISGLGPDGVFNTADDVLSGRQEWLFQPDGYSSVVYLSGTDGTFFTADDLANGRIDYVETATGFQTHIRTAGPDHVFMTADDGYSKFCNVVFDADGYDKTYDCYAGAGADGQWKTADDVLTYYWVTTTTPTLRKRIEYDGPGPDGIWRTADDQVASRDEYTLAHGALFMAWHGFSPGPDGVLDTADDVATSGIYYKRAANGLLQEYGIAYDPGPDGTWFTADDKLTSYGIYEYDAAGSATRRLNYDTGADRAPHTGDDTLFSTTHYDPR